MQHHTCLLEKPVEELLAELRKQYLVADKQTRLTLVSEANRLKTLRPKLCYQCQRCEFTPEFLPFCSNECHETWAAANYPKSPVKRPVTVEGMKRKILAMKKQQYLQEKLEQKEIEK